MSAWISVKERLPEDSAIVLAYFNGGTIATAVYFADSYYKWSHDLDDGYAVPTHWQPLPEPPEER